VDREDFRRIPPPGGQKPEARQRAKNRGWRRSRPMRRAGTGGCSRPASDLAGRARPADVFEGGERVPALGRSPRGADQADPHRVKQRRQFAVAAFVQLVSRNQFHRFAPVFPRPRHGAFHAARTACRRTGVQGLRRRGTPHQLARGKIAWVTPICLLPSLHPLPCTFPSLRWAVSAALCCSPARRRDRVCKRSGRLRGEPAAVSEAGRKAFRSAPRAEP
jgi:hypothetical protein